jgi:hypothetical protein
MELLGGVAGRCAQPLGYPGTLEEEANDGFRVLQCELTVAERLLLGVDRETGWAAHPEMDPSGPLSESEAKEAEQCGGVDAPERCGHGEVPQDGFCGEALVIWKTYRRSCRLL